MTQTELATAVSQLPLKSRCTESFVGIVAELGCSIAFTTYKSGKVVILSETNGQLIQLPRDFVRPMGMVVDGKRMAVATRDEVVVLGDALGLAQHYPGHPGVYDHLWTPRASYYSTPIDAHDIAWGGDKLYGINTRFSCLCTFGDQYSFVPVWQPPFITDLMPEDRCHLNGLAMESDKPTWVTALGVSDEAQGWRKNRAEGGVLINVDSGDIVLEGLCMPHSPRVIDGVLYVLNSGTGELLSVDPQRGTTEAICTLPGFARGMSQLGDYLAIGLSVLRDNRSFGGLPLEERSDELVCGVALVNPKSGEIAGTFYYETGCEELYDVQVMHGMRRPGIIGLAGDLHRCALTAPDFVGWADPPKSKPTEGPNPYVEAVKSRSRA